MAIAKVIYNDPENNTTETWMDVTQDTVSTGTLVSPETATKNDGTQITGALIPKSSSDLTVSGNTVTAPAGVYSSAASKSVATTTHPNPTVSVNTSTGLITASHTQGTGYVTGGTTTGTTQLSTQAGTTITPTTSEQTAVAANKYTLGAVKVAAMPSGTAGTPTAAKGTVSNHSVSVTPSVTNSAGYIVGGTKTGTAVSVSASELVSGNKAIVANGSNIDVTNYATVSVNVPTGGGTPTAEPKDINFFDYDGTLVYSYDLSDLPLSALPQLPDHSGDEIPLTGEGWNWSLTDINALTRSMNVGAVYRPTDGKTHIVIELDNPDLLSPYLKFTVNGTAVVDWGDSSATSTVTGTSLSTVKYTQHIYAGVGRYDITISATSGSYRFYNSYILSHTNGTGSNGTNSPSLRYNSSVVAVRIGSSVTSIGTYAFNNCYSLQSVTIPNSVTSIGTYAFSNCYPLQSVTIPNSVTSIGSYAFRNCYPLQSVTIPNSVTTIYNYTFYSCSSLQSVTIPNSVTKIYDYAFQSCYSLQLTMSENATSIGTYAFNNCWALQSVTIPNGVTSIGNYTFYSCYSLQSVTIPNSVTSIGNNAFYNCYSLCGVRFLSATPPSVNSSSAFANLPTDCIIYVPTGSLSAYTSATNYPDPNTYTYVEE